MSLESPALRVSVVIPLRDEAATSARLVEELERCLDPLRPCEVVCVDDGSVDGTAEIIAGLMGGRSWLRLVRHAAPCGKSAALWTGAHAARAPVVVTMNGDGRNDPVVLPRMVAELAEAGPGCGLVLAQRLGRYDTALRRLRSKVGSLLRGALLDEAGVRDTTSGLACLPRQVLVELAYFDGLHRYLAALVRRDGYAISLIDVDDRPAWSGKPRPGALQDAGRHFVDLLGVWWFTRRRGPILVIPAPPQVPPLADRTTTEGVQTP